ncbi:helix-turn-helix domain-containing protein [Bacillus infantis]|uniref:helix-turn-helix domain-containing protein n=1 Tax=Bacillus infantis TaxID=324767 RepID=UPI003CF6D50A
MTNTSLLRNKIDGSGLKLKFIADKMGISYYTLQKKINNVTEFTASEIDMLCNILSIDSLEERQSIFFAV